MAVRTAGGTWTETPKKVLCIRFDYNPPADPMANSVFSASELSAYMITCSNAFREMSYGKTWLIPTVTPQLTLPHSQSYYSTGGDRGGDARSAAINAGYVLGDYQILVYSFPIPGGDASASGTNVSLSGRSAVWAGIHEFGHSYGLGHADMWYGHTGSGFLGHHLPSGRANEHIPYGDFTDIMGSGVWPGHFSMYGKAMLNWIEPAEILTVTNSGKYRVYRFDHISARQNPGTKLALTVTNANGEALWVGFRREYYTNHPAIAQSPAVSTGAYIVWPEQPGHLYAIDATPLSKPNQTFDVERHDTPLPPSQSYTDPSGTVRITNLGWGGSEPYEYLDLEVELLTRQPAFELFTTSDRTTRGLIGSYVSSSLNGHTAQDDWTNTSSGVAIAGRRIDPTLNFRTLGWGTLNSVGLAAGVNGTDSDWNNYSVQWDGVIAVRRPMTIGTMSADSSRMWVDLNSDGTFGVNSPEFVSNNWGQGQGATVGNANRRINPGTYRIRVQFETRDSYNYLALISSDVQFEVFTDVNLATNGMVGSYVNGSLRARTAQDDWTAAPSGVSIAGRRVDSYPGFFADNNWGTPSSVGLTNSIWSNFSVQWDGFLRVYRATRFATTSADCSQMWIDLNGDGALSAPERVNNHWGQIQGLITGELSPVVNPGTYRLRLQYAGEQNISFILFGAPAEATAPTGTGTGLIGEYYSNADFTGSRATRIDPTINFNWNLLHPHPAILTADTFSVRWSGYVVPTNTETYTFYTVADDGGRLWVNHQPLVNDWTLHTATTNSGSILLQAGQAYPVRMEMFENTGDAVARLYWSSAHTPLSVVPQSQLYSEPQQCTPAPSDMIAWWTGDGQAQDEAGANHGFLKDGTVFDSGYIGQAFSFDGVNDHVSVSSTGILSGPRTVEAWVYPHAHSGFGMPIVTGGEAGAADIFGVAGTTGDCNNGQYRLYLDHWGDACLDSTLSLTPETWNHVAYTWNGTALRFYVNGVAGAVITQSLYSYDIDEIKIGGNLIGGTTTQPSFDGLIDEVTVYSRALADWEIQSIYATGQMGKCRTPSSTLSPPTNLIAWWTGNQNAYDVVDGSHGTLNNGVTFTAGRVGMAFNFDGLDDYVNIGGNGYISGPRTVEAWIHPRTHSGAGMPILTTGVAGAGDMFGVAGTTGGCGIGQYQLYLDHWGSACLDSNSGVTVNAWNHVAFTFDGSNVRFYVNGVGSSTISRVLYNYNINTVTIGGNLIGGTTTQPSFDGLIDEVSVYDRALTASEIFALATGGIGKTIPPRFRAIIQPPWAEDCLVLTWPRLEGYILQWAPTVDSPSWFTVTDEPMLADGENLLLIPLSKQENKFFRLYRP